MLLFLNIINDIVNKVKMLKFKLKSHQPIHSSASITATEINLQIKNFLLFFLFFYARTWIIFERPNVQVKFKVSKLFHNAQNIIVNSPNVKIFYHYFFLKRKKGLTNFRQPYKPHLSPLMLFLIDCTYAGVNTE